MTKPATTVTTTENEPAISIPKPPAFDLSAMVAKEPVSSIQRMAMALPVKRFSDVGDFAKLHPDDRLPEEGGYWTDRLCFVDVPVKGASKRVRHFIHPALATKHLPAKLVKHYRLALGMDADGKHFLCEIPTENKDNTWNKSNLEICEIAKTRWVMANSQNQDGLEGYQAGFPLSPDGFEEQRKTLAWTTQPMAEIVGKAFAKAIILTDDDPALLRVIGG